MKYNSGGFGDEYSGASGLDAGASSGLRKAGNVGKAGLRKLNKMGRRGIKKATKGLFKGIKKTKPKGLVKLALTIMSLVVLGIVFFTLCYYGSGESDGKTQSYIDSNNVTNKDGVVTYSNANANCKAFYRCLAQTTIYQEVVDEDGSKVLINRDDDRYKYDYFRRGQDFYIDPDLLFCLNDFIFGEHFVYPEAFTKPVAYNPDTYELLELVDDDGKVIVLSDKRDLMGQPTGDKINSVSDYGLSTVCTYTSFVKSKVLAGTYVKQEVFNEETGEIEQEEISEPFNIVLESESHDILDKVVTYAGTIDYEYRQTYVLQEAVAEGNTSENQSDNVENVLYDSVDVHTYYAVDESGNVKSFNASLDVILNSIEDDDIMTGLETFIAECEESGYELRKNEDGSYYYEENTLNLYKSRSLDSGIHISSVTPLNSTSEENNNRYLYEYLSAFTTYKPFIKRSYTTLKRMTSQANISSYQAYVNYSGDNVATGDVNDPIIIELGEAAAEDMSESGILASFTVAQALLESGYGNGVYSELAMDYNNWFGIKAGSDWQGETINFSTRELDSDGNEYYTDAEWCVFPDRLSGLQYHSRFIWNTTNGVKYRYRDCAGLTDYSEICAVLKDGGYFTEDLEIYTKGIISLVERYNLTRFDTGKWDGTPPYYATDSGFKNDTFDSVTLQASTTLNEADKIAFNEFFHATDNIYDGDTTFVYYSKSLSMNEIDKLLRKANSFINQTTLSQESLTDSLWETGYLTDLSNNKRKLAYNGDMAQLIAEVAKSHLGKNHEEFVNEFYGYYNPVDWCAVFVWCVFNQADATYSIGDNIVENDPIHYLEDNDGNNIETPTTYAKAYYEWGVRCNRLVDDLEGECGDIVVFCWDDEQPCYDHTGIIIENLGNGMYRTIEGNVGGSSCLDSLCVERIRSIDVIVGIIRPMY